MTFCAEGAEKIFLRALLIPVQEAIATHAATDFGRRVEQGWTDRFLCRRASRHTGLAGGENLALLFHVEERGRRR